MTMNKQTAASSKYNKANTKSFAFRLNVTYDKDLIEFLDSLDNKSKWFKETIRREMTRPR
jgi:hypothetical protein